MCYILCIYQHLLFFYKNYCKQIAKTGPWYIINRNLSKNNLIFFGNTNTCAVRVFMIENSDICESAGINPIPKRNRITLFELLFILFVGIIGFVWMHYLPFNGGPDETMRFLIPQYIYHYGSLPNGADSAVIDSRWGTSYGFTPIFSYIVSAVFM